MDGVGVWFKQFDVDQITASIKCWPAEVAGAEGDTIGLLHHLNQRHMTEHQECLRVTTASAASGNAGELVKPKSSQVSLKHWGSTLHIKEMNTIHVTKWRFIL